MMLRTTMICFIFAACSVMSQQNQDWHVGADKVRQGGVNVHGHANIPLHRDSNSRLDGNVHGSRVMGGPYNGQQSVGGGLQYGNRNGWSAGADVTRHRGQETVYGLSVKKTFRRKRSPRTVA